MKLHVKFFRLIPLIIDIKQEKSDTWFYTCLHRDEISKQIFTGNCTCVRSHILFQTKNMTCYMGVSFLFQTEEHKDRFCRCNLSFVLICLCPKNNNCYRMLPFCFRQKNIRTDFLCKYKLMYFMFLCPKTFKKYLSMLTS